MVCRPGCGRGLRGDRRNGPARCALWDRACATRSAARRTGRARHDRDGDRFIVRGMVKNPGTAAVDGLVAAVSVFDQDGELIGAATPQSRRPDSRPAPKRRLSSLWLEPET